MSVSFYEFLGSKQKETTFLQSDEMRFFIENRVLLTGIEGYSRYLKASDPFLIVRANILIRGLLNKKTIEKLYYEKSRKKNKDDYLPLEEFMSLGMSELPYMVYEDERIYIPSFPVSINKIYGHDFSKLGKQPYKQLLSTYEPLLIDTFDYYGYKIYDSYFTKLVKIKEENGVAAFFDYDADTLYFINDQGRVDAKLALFDKYLEKVVKTHLSKRLEKVVDAYFYEDKEALISSLLDNGFISLRFLSEYRKKESR